MITIVHHEVHNDDSRMLRALEIKFKADKESTNNLLMSHVTMAVAETTIMEDNGDAIRLSQDEDRNNIVDLLIKFKDNNLSYKDIANLLDTIQTALDSPKYNLGL